MGGIIDLSDKIAQANVQKHQEKLEAARRLFLCSGCPSKCSKCGVQIDVSDHACVGAAEQVLRFCPSCSEDYSEYKRRKEGKATSQVYWHNEHWIAMWDAWLEYQKTINDYRKSKEFIQLLDDLNA
jgi:hypothetical protein